MRFIEPIMFHILTPLKANIYIYTHLNSHLCISTHIFLNALLAVELTPRSEKLCGWCFLPRSLVKASLKYCRVSHPFSNSHTQLYISVFVLLSPSLSVCTLGKVFIRVSGQTKYSQRISERRRD